MDQIGYQLIQWGGLANFSAFGDRCAINTVYFGFPFMQDIGIHGSDMAAGDGCDILNILVDLLKVKMHSRGIDNFHSLLNQLIRSRLGKWIIDNALVCVTDQSTDCIDADVYENLAPDEFFYI